jgi:hypothetical protein
MSAIGGGQELTKGFIDRRVVVVVAVHHDDHLTAARAGVVRAERQEEPGVNADVGRSVETAYGKMFGRSCRIGAGTFVAGVRAR